MNGQTEATGTSPGAVVVESSHRPGPRNGTQRRSAPATTARSSRVVTVAVLGCGRWGPNHARVFTQLARSELAACADPDAAKLDGIQRRFPHVRTTPDYRALLHDETIDAVVIATPTATHAELAREALRAGKHVLLEKPMCTRPEEVCELQAVAVEAERTLMVGHVFLFNDGIVKLKQLIDAGELGALSYLDAVRTNLGPIRGDVGALLDLGTHDISILNHLVGARPTEVSAVARCITQASIDDVCFATLLYPGGTLAHLHVSWLNPLKVRTLTVVGARQMASWDDIDPVDTLRLYDKGVSEPPSYDSFGEFHYRLRNADVHLPAIQRIEPLVNQAEAFLDCVVDGAPCRSGASEALDVALVLEAAGRSIRAGGAPTPVPHHLSIPR